MNFKLVFSKKYFKETYAYYRYSSYKFNILLKVCKDQKYFRIQEYYYF